MSWFGNALVWMGFRAKYGLILEDRLDTDIATISSVCITDLLVGHLVYTVSLDLLIIWP